MQTSPDALEQQPKMPGEVTKLRQAFQECQRHLEKGQSMLEAAHGRADPCSTEYQTIQRRLRNGETIGQIQQKSAINVASLQMVALDNELPYRQAQAKLFEVQGVIPASDQELLAALDARQFDRRTRLGTPVDQHIINGYIDRQLARGVTIESIRTAAQNRVSQIAQEEDRQRREEYRAVLLRLGRISGEKEEVLHKQQLAEQELAQGNTPEVRLGITTLETIQKYAERVSFGEWGRRQSSFNWEPDPNNELCPAFRLTDPGVIAADVIDLRVAAPGTLFHWFGTHPGAYYFLRIEPNNMVKVWRGSGTGLVGRVDQIEMFDLVKRGGDEVIRYPGALISRHVSNQDVPARVSMPYFHYDQKGRATEPTSGDAWVDSVEQIHVKPAR